MAGKYFRITFKVSPSGSGYVTRSTATNTAASYDDVLEGQRFKFYARPNSGYRFSHWVGTDGYISYENPPYGWADRHETWTAHFEKKAPVTYTLTYTKYSDKFCENKKIKMNFMKCSLFDNTALSEYQKQELLNTYPDKNSVEYQRGILGNRACSDGLIFTLFAKDSSPWVLNDLNESLKGITVQFISIGVDFGGNGSNTAFCATLICNNYHLIIPFFDDEIDMKGGNSDVVEFHERFKSFLLTVISMNLGVVRYVYGDCADPVMINEIRNVIKELRLANQVRVLDCKKHTIKERIDTKKVLMAKGHWKVYKDSINVISSTKLQVWDNREGHEDERVDNGSKTGEGVGVIDIADAEEYSWSGFLDKLIKYCK